MKKLVYSAIFLLMWVLFSNFQCEEDGHGRGSWYVSNATEETLVVNIVTAKGTDEILIKAGNRNELLAWYYFDNPVFDDISSAIWGDTLSLANAKVVVESEDGEVLRTWSYEGREDEGRQFFNGKDWLSFVPTSGTLAWEFTILPEDLVQE